MKISPESISLNLNSLLAFENQPAPAPLPQTPKLNSAIVSTLSQNHSESGILKTQNLIDLQYQLHQQAFKIELLSKTAESAAVSIRRLSQANH